MHFYFSDKFSSLSGFWNLFNRKSNKYTKSKKDEYKKNVGHYILLKSEAKKLEKSQVPIFLKMGTWFLRVIKKWEPCKLKLNRNSYPEKYAICFRIEN